MQETWVQFLGRKDPLEEEMATHSSSLAWRIPWTEEPGGLSSMGSQRVGHDWATKPPRPLFSAYTEEIPGSGLSQSTGAALPKSWPDKVPWGRPLCVIIITKQPKAKGKRKKKRSKVESDLALPFNINCAGSIRYLKNKMTKTPLHISKLWWYYLCALVF